MGRRRETATLEQAPSRVLLQIDQPPPRRTAAHGVERGVDFLERKLVRDDAVEVAGYRIFRHHRSRSVIWPRWIPTSSAFSAAVTGPRLPSPIVKSPCVLLIFPIAATTAAVPQAKHSRSLPLAASARH